MNRVASRTLSLSYVAAMAFGAVLLLAVPAHAKEPASKPVKAKKATRTSQTTQARKKADKNYDFSADEIDGSRVGPGNTTLFGLRSLRHDSLIRLRGDFIREIIKTAETL